MSILRKITLLFTCLVIFISAFAQEKQAPEGIMRSSGRIYVVVAVVLTILIGLILYIVRLDRKITKLEKDS